MLHAVKSMSLVITIRESYRIKCLSFYRQSLRDSKDVHVSTLSALNRRARCTRHNEFRIPIIYIYIKAPASRVASEKAARFEAAH